MANHMVNIEFIVTRNRYQHLLTIHAGVNISHHDKKVGVDTLFITDI